MSEGEDNEVDAQPCECCAFCGIAEIDDIKLVPCDDCDLVRYCGDACQRNHKSEHEEACKIRAAELRDELLFKQPEETYLGDCPICTLPLSLDQRKSTFMTCCSKFICNGCRRANWTREHERRLQHVCPFCREALPDTMEECLNQNMKRIAANDPCAICYEGVTKYKKGDHNGAVEYLTRAAELGDVKAFYQLSILYRSGEGVEKDEEKHIHHLKVAAIGGHPVARYNLGNYECRNHNTERAAKHWIIAATQGYDDAIKVLMNMFKGGFVSKEDLAAALRAHKAAVDATKSPLRKVAEEYYKSNVSLTLSQSRA